MAFLFVLAVSGASGGAAPLHSADTAIPQHALSLSEILRVVQFYNAGAYHCDGASEDGFAPMTGDHSCAQHDSDYAPRDWAVGLSELLRLIQLFNAGAYHCCEIGEDGYCSGSGTDTCPLPVSIPDLALDAAIRDAIGKPFGSLFPEDLAAGTFNELNAPLSGISDLSGLEFAISLTTLDLHGNCISNISPLSSLTDLKRLNLYDNGISDIGPLQGLSTLSLLWLGRNQISDVAPLAQNLGLDGTPGNADRIDLSFNPLSVQAGVLLDSVDARGAYVWRPTANATGGSCSPVEQTGDPLPVTARLIHGDTQIPDDRAFVLLVMGDAFPEGELGDPRAPFALSNTHYIPFAEAVADSMNFILQQEPFAQFAAWIKVYRVDLVSRDNRPTDTSVDPPVEHDTALRMVKKPVGFDYDQALCAVGSSRVDLQACKLEYSIVSPK